MHTGRIVKRSTSRAPYTHRKVKVISLSEEVYRINQELGRVKDKETLEGNDKSGTGIRSVARAALLSCGMFMSVGAALLLSSSSSTSFTNLPSQAQDYLLTLKDSVVQNFH